MRNLRIGTRILATFFLLAGLMALVLTSGLLILAKVASYSTLLVEVRAPNYASVAVIDEAETDAARAVLGLANDRLPDELRDRLYQDASAAFQRMDAEWKAFQARPKPEAAAKAVEELQGPWAAWRSAAEAALQAERERDRTPPGTGYRKAANDQVTAALVAHDAAFRASDPAIRRLLELVRARMDQDGAEAHSFVVSASIEVILAFLLVAAVVLLVGRGLARSIGAIFAGVSQKLERLAAGELPEPITEVRGEDFNRLRDSFNAVVDALRRFVAEMRTMSDEHERGEIDAAIVAAPFSGEFRTMAEGVNEMVRAHLAVNRKAMAIFAEFGRGNFDATLEPLPGKKRFINDTVEQVRANLKALIAEMNRVSVEHERGDIDAVIDEGRFPGAYRTMAHGVNEMVGAHIAVKRKAVAVFAEFGRGNFDAALEPLPGKKRFINDAVEQVRGNFRSLVADAASLSKAAVEGRLEVRADASRQPGGFRTIVEGMNDTMDALAAPMRDLASVLQLLAEGNLTARADASRYQNEVRRLLAGVNETLAALLAPVSEATQVLGRLAQRDLRARMEGAYRGDHAAMKQALNASVEALDQALAQVAQAADQVSSASSQIASSSQAVASGAGAQASSLAETTSSIESVSSIARQAADSSQQANALAQSARSAAHEGAAAVEHMQAAMAKIRGSAEGTSQIIRDVSDIAFQTNLLALNAAVEAARAGEAGRGFAVVAEEVRSLALRAKEAATKTEELIRQSVAQTGEGELASQQVAGKLAEILAGVGKVSDIVSEITQASREQAVGVEQVTRSISQIEKITQQNAASAEESSSTASELSSQSEELAAMVGAFHLSSGSAPRRAEAPAAAPAKLPPAKSAPAKLPPAKVPPVKLPPAKVPPAKLAPAKLPAAKLSPEKLPPARRNGASGQARPAEDPFPMDDDAPLRGF
jgi:methyl-accepting chemotaxis protein